MCDILIFGGTTEGRQLAEFCAGHGINACISVATEYGAELLPQSEYVHINIGREDASGIAGMIEKLGVSAVIDATHPYAKEVTKNITAACTEKNVTLYRIKRADDAICESAIYFDDVTAAAEYLDTVNGNALITTGSKELAAFTAVHDYAKRFTARVLDLPKVIAECRALGFPNEKIIAEKGPFTLEQNIKHIKRSSAEFLVTKDSGNAGGFAEKVNAAQVCGAGLIIIKRPDENGISLEEAENILLGRCRSE